MTFQTLTGFNYSLDEEKTENKWIDGKPIYRKVIDFGALPNATTKLVAHNISNLGIITTLKAYAKRTSTGVILNLPYVSYQAVTNNINISVDSTNIDIDSAVNFSAYDKTYVIIEYTKTTD